MGERTERRKADDCRLERLNATYAIHVFFYKQRVYKPTQPQIREILSTLLSTPPASDFEIDDKISEKLLLFPKIIEKKLQFVFKILNQ